MTLSEPNVLKTLKTRFICGTKNIEGESYSGFSNENETTDPATWTTNGAGPHNMQLFVLSSDGTVLHCLPGFWAPQDLLFEIEFALGLDKIWKNPSLSREQKSSLFRKAHLQHVRSHPQEMMERSHLQGFDAKYEKNRRINSDFQVQDWDYRPPFRLRGGIFAMYPEFKGTDHVMHQRMAARPFLPYEGFDVAEYSDYGRPLYQKLQGTPERFTQMVARFAGIPEDKILDRAHQKGSQVYRQISEMMAYSERTHNANRRMVERAVDLLE